MSCPVYCRFCFRKHKESRNMANPTVADVRQAVAHVAASPAIKEVVITGGDPFLNRANMAAAIDGLLSVDHVQTLRLATRSIAYYPHLFLENDEALLRYLKDKNRELRQTGKRMEVATHFIHPDEISPQCLRIIGDLVKSGIAVYIQTPFLKDCNDEGPELVKLFSLLRGAGAELHYIYIPCSPIHGNSIYWTPIAKGLAAGNYLRAHLSDRVIPRICTATPIGKMDWHSSGWAVEPVEGQDDFIWIRSPYTPQYFKEFAPLAKELDNLRVNAEGTIDVQYMARLGDDTLFLGARPPRKARKKRRSQADSLALLAQQYDRPLPSIVNTRAHAIARLHETRVEIDAAEMNADLAYIRADERITDVVVWTANDIAASLAYIEDLIKKLRKINHVNAVRLRSLAFNYAPQTFDRTRIDRLAGLNHLSVVHPLRLEIETQFLSADEFHAAHQKLAGQLNRAGITVYNNTPLLGGINDTPSAIHALAYQCRQAGIEFHHLYVAGMPLQGFLNQDHPVSLYDVVDIATQVRREGSGREIPRYILRTPLGEVDFGLTSTFVSVGDKLALKLLPYELSYFQGMDPDFSWPAGVRTDEAGRPIVGLKGIRKETDFALS
jgi:L-lysine 2,3-aminomutase